MKQRDFNFACAKPITPEHRAEIDKLVAEGRMIRLSDPPDDMRICKEPPIFKKNTPEENERAIKEAIEEALRNRK